MTTTAMIGLRPVSDDDDAFLCELYASTRREELDPLGWSPVGEDAVVVAGLCLELLAQEGEHYLEASRQVIEFEGRPIGRLYVARWDDEIRIVDIALLPEHRGRGIGSRLLSVLLDEAAASGSRVSIHVERFNPAMRLYERLGFVPVADRGVYLLMEALPGSAPGSLGPDPRARREG